MKSLITDSLRYLVQINAVHFYFVIELWGVGLAVCVYQKEHRSPLGFCRFSAYYKTKMIFHWCDLCGAPRIRGVNL